LVFGTGIFQINKIISTFLASLLAADRVSCLSHAHRLFELPIGIFVVALSTAVLPRLAPQAQQRDMRAVQDNLGVAVRLANLVTLPAAPSLAALAVPITAGVFCRGAFSVQDIVVTVAALQGLAVGLWAVSTIRQYTACLYALGDTKTPV
jgi:putative peptidoglycan lipid II flippase